MTVMQKQIEHIPAYRIAYIRQTGPYGEDNNKIMEKLKTWAKANNLLDENSIILGIAQDNPQNTKPENCRYDTCLVISNDYSVNDDNVRQGNLLGGKYLVFTIEHTAEAVQKAWAKIFSELNNCDYKLDNTRPILERYKLELVSRHFCEICVPIR